MRISTRILLFLMALPLITLAQTPTTPGKSSKNTFTGASAFPTIDNILFMDGVKFSDNSTGLTAACAAVGSSGTVVIPAAITMTANVTCSSGVTLQFIPPGSITTTGYTLTINGQIIAPPVQIFSGTGTIVLGTSNPVRAIWFPGSDFHAKLQGAYNALPAAPSAAKIYADPNPTGGCWVTTTTASFNTSEKYAQIVAEAPASPNVPQKGFCDNFTPTIIGSAVDINFISTSADLTTVVCSATCTTGWTGGGGASATIVTIRGVTVPDYNGVWQVKTITNGTTFTFNSYFGSPTASSGGTVAQSPYAIELDWTPPGGGGYDPTAGISGYTLDNNECSSVGGCGNYAIGFLIGRTNAGIHASTLNNVILHGFGTGIAKLNSTNGGTSWGTKFCNTSLVWNNVGAFYGVANENDTWSCGSIIAVNGVGFQMAGYGSEIAYYGGSIDSQTICSVQLDAGAIWHSTDVHYENNGLTTTHYICSSQLNSIADIKGGIMYDDDSNGGDTTDNYVSAGVLSVKGLLIHSNGRVISGGSIFKCATNCDVNILEANNVLPRSVMLNTSMVGVLSGAISSDRFVQAPSIRGNVITADQGAACTNGELSLSAGWGSTAAVSAVAGTGQTCQWTITSNGSGAGANPTITDKLTNALPSASTVCDMRMVGGSETATLINQTTLSGTAPVFTFLGTPVGGGATYIVVRRCGP